MTLPDTTPDVPPLTSTATMARRINERSALNTILREKISEPGKEYNGQWVRKDGHEPGTGIRPYLR